MSNPSKSTAARPLIPAEDANLVPAVFVAAGGGRLIRLVLGTNLLGRAHNARVRIDQDGVSRRHAKLVVHDDGRVELTDLGSTNGTFVDTERVHSVILCDGARVRLGRDAELRFGWWDERMLGSGQSTEVELTARELQIVRLVARGLSNTEVAEKLGISCRTVTTHLTNVYNRTGIKSRTALVRYLLDSGLGQ